MELFSKKIRHRSIELCMLQHKRFNEEFCVYAFQHTNVIASRCQIICLRSFLVQRSGQNVFETICPRSFLVKRSG